MKYFSSAVAVFSKGVFPIKTFFLPAFFAGIVLCLAAVLHADHPGNERELAFFANALTEKSVPETVVVQDEMYLVKNGEVFQNDTAVEGKRALQALRLAYAKTIAKQNPPLALPGVNLENYNAALLELETVRNAIVDLQNTEKAKTAIREGLYPIDFLHATLDTEKKRRRFIATGSDTDARAYHHALVRSTQIHQKNLEHFKKMFVESVPIDVPRYGTANYVVSRDEIIASIGAIAERIQRMQHTIVNTQKCMHGLTAFCKEEYLNTPTLAEYPKPLIDSSDLALIAQAREFYKQIGLSTESEPLVILSGSSCVHAQTAPPVFTFWHDTAGNIGVAAIGNPRFAKVEAGDHIPFFEYFKERGVSYAAGKEFNHYNCLNIGEDVGRIFATKHTARYAAQKPLSTYVPAEQEDEFKNLEQAFASGVIYESDAVAYLKLGMSLAKADTIPRNIQNDIRDLMLQFHSRSAGLAWVVENIVYSESRNVFLVKSGFDPALTEAPHVFYTRSAYLPLNMMHNPLFGETVALFDKKTSPHADEPFVYFSEFSQSPDLLEKLTRDMRVYLQAHTP